ncbi:MAG: hypothetical protein WCL50_12485 [Spirochaetota bacterium]
MRQLFALLVILSLANVYLLGQDSSLPANPTRLRVAIKATEVVLAWEAATDAPGGWAIFRSSEVITEANFPKATQLGIVLPGDRSYSTSPPDRAAYYYAVVALDAAKKPRKSFVPGKNLTAAAIANENILAKPAQIVSAANPGPAIDSLNVTVTTDAVKLSFKVGKGTGNVLVYRGISAFSSPMNLLDATLISTVPETVSEFVDYPVPGLGYYYALIPEAALKSGKIEFKAGANASSRASVIASTALYGALPEIGDLARITPLPSYLFGNPMTRNGKKRVVALSPDAEKAISTILAAYPSPRLQIPSLAILNEDKGQAKGGEDYALSLIIQGALKRADYPAAIEQLQNYLSLNRSKAVASRAHFYLGQSLAATGSYRDAFFEFLQARDLHAAESKPWILYVIAVLRG